jgi:hypothetical protein
MPVKVEVIPCNNLKMARVELNFLKKKDLRKKWESAEMDVLANAAVRTKTAVVKTVNSQCQRLSFKIGFMTS